MATKYFQNLTDFQELLWLADQGRSARALSIRFNLPQNIIVSKLKPYGITLKKRPKSAADILADRYLLQKHIDQEKQNKPLTSVYSLHTKDEKTNQGHSYKEYLDRSEEKIIDKIPLYKKKTRNLKVKLCSQGHTYIPVRGECMMCERENLASS